MRVWRNIFLFLRFFNFSFGTKKFSKTVCLITLPYIRNSFGGGKNFEGTNFHPKKVKQPFKFHNCFKISKTRFNLFETTSCSLKSSAISFFNFKNFSSFEVFINSFFLRVLNWSSRILTWNFKFEYSDSILQYLSKYMSPKRTRFKSKKIVSTKNKLSN